MLKPAPCHRALVAWPAEATAYGYLCYGYLCPERGAQTLFLLTQYYQDMIELQHSAIVAARDAGVARVVKVSAFAASDHSRAPIGRWQYQVEQELRASGMGWTILRPHHFMQNLLGQVDYIVTDGFVYSPSGDGLIPYVDARDVARSPSSGSPSPDMWKNLCRDRIGGSLLSAGQQIISATIGKPLRFIDESPEESRARLREGLPPAVIESTLVIGAY